MIDSRIIGKRIVSIKREKDRIKTMFEDGTFWTILFPTEQQ